MADGQNENYEEFLRCAEKDMKNGVPNFKERSLNEQVDLLEVYFRGYGRAYHAYERVRKAFNNKSENQMKRDLLARLT